MGSLCKIIRVDPERRVLCVEAGCTVGQILDECGRHQMSFPSVPSIKTMTIAGAISTGSHGSGRNYGDISTRVLGLKIVLPGGKVLTCSADENTAVFRGALCSIGALGIIVEVTLQAEPEFAIAQSYQWGPFDGNFVALANEFEFVKLYGYPGNKNFLKIAGNKIARPQYLKTSGSGSWWKRLETAIFQFVYAVLPSQRANSVWSFFLRRFYRAAPIVDELASPILEIPQFTSEWAVPIDEAPQFWTNLMDLIQRRPDYPAHFVEARFTKAGTQTLISPTSSDDENDLFVYFGFVTFKPFGRLPALQAELQAEFDNLCVQAKGRPHWAKSHLLTAKDFERIHGVRWTLFQAVRLKCDPHGILMNDELKKICN